MRFSIGKPESNEEEAFVAVLDAAGSGSAIYIQLAAANAAAKLASDMMTASFTGMSRKLNRSYLIVILARATSSRCQELSASTGS
jgi:hypothetical protein